MRCSTRKNKEKIKDRNGKLGFGGGVSEWRKYFNGLLNFGNDRERKLKNKRRRETDDFSEKEVEAVRNKMNCVKFGWLHENTPEFVKYKGGIILK